MFIDSWQWDKSSSWHASSGVSSVQPPPPPEENVNTQNTNSLTNMEIYIIPVHLVYSPIRHSTLPRSISLLPSSSFSLSLAVCSVIGRSFVIQQIPSSNLFMVVVDNKCDCSMFEPITMDPIEIMYILRWPKKLERWGWWSAGPQQAYSCLLVFWKRGRRIFKAWELHLTRVLRWVEQQLQ